MTVEVESFDLFAKEPLPEAEWLIEGVIERDSLAVLWGASGTGKSFVALDMALCIATGETWLGAYKTKRGDVFICMGEGARGGRRRARGWAKHRGIESIPGAYFYPAAPLIRDPKVLEAFLKEVKKKMPKLVIIDTLARSFTGDENSAGDMNEWVKAAVRIQQETGACVLIVHHTAKAVKKGSKPTERGSGALRGAVDTSIYVSKGDLNVVTIENPKQKDGKEFDPITVELQEVVLREATGEKPRMTTLVIAPSEGPMALLSIDTAEPRDLALALLERASPLSKTEWLAMLHEEQTKHKLPLTPKSTFMRWPEKFLKEGQIVLEDGKYAPAGEEEEED
jgi:hypothetical protein